MHGSDLLHPKEALHHHKRNESKSSAGSVISSGGFSDTNTCQRAKYGRLNGKLLGKGAWGTVKCILRRNDQKQFAVKKFRAKTSSEDQRTYVKTVLGEYTIASLFHHPYVIETLDLIVEDGRYFQIMEYCPTDLFTVLKERQPRPSADQIDKWFKEIVTGIDYMHNLGVVHRDVKCENILLDPYDRVKIIDFGLADVYKTAFETKPRLSKGKSGSPPYMAPEIHLHPKGYDGRQVDVWSLGILYLTMQVGAFPWNEATNEDDHFHRYLGRKCCLDRTFLQVLSQERSNLVHQMLQVDPEKRITVKGILADPVLSEIEV
ncbi:serine/threonine protein kinase [Basidiobolus ranarum]|uniref:Serine/threonine protein kinase n=1 Tax=Basidiobolus ranarum TaxID=34480 RepID=A0ABR2VXJ8_9FUNG